MRRLVAAGEPQPLRRPMGGAADAGRAIGELAALLRGGDQVLHGLEAARGVHHRHVRDGAERNDAGEVAHRIVAEIGIGRGRRRMRGGLDQQRVAVGLGLDDGGGADRAAGAAAVLDHDGLAELARQRVHHDAPDDVERAARRERDHGPDLARRIALRCRDPRQRRRRERGGGHGQECAARGHGRSLPRSLLFQSSAAVTAATSDNMS